MLDLAGLVGSLRRDLLQHLMQWDSRVWQLVLLLLMRVVGICVLLNLQHERLWSRNCPLDRSKLYYTVQLTVAPDDLIKHQ